MKKITDTIKLLFADFIAGKDKHRIKTIVSIYAGDEKTLLLNKGKNLNKPLIVTENKTALYGRVFLNENVSGININSSQHNLTLNSLYNVNHSINLFDENALDSRGNILGKAASNRSCQYVMIGRGAYNPASPMNPYPAKNFNTNLYGAIPFVYRKTSEDLTTEEKMNYALRTIVLDQETGEDRVAYYAKKINSVTNTTTENGITYIPSISDNDPNIEESSKTIECVSTYSFNIAKTDFVEFFTATNSDNRVFNEFGLILGEYLPDPSNNGISEISTAELLSHVTTNNMSLEDASYDIEYKIYS